MGLPELSFAYSAAAQTASNRSKKGIVALILRDTGLESGVYTVSHNSDIPAELGSENKDYVRRALIGYVNTPSKVLLAVLPSGDGESDPAPADGLALLTAMDYDYVAGPPDLTAEEAAAIALKVKELRQKNYIGKAVLPKTATDSEFIVNFSAEEIAVGEKICTAAEYCSRIAGILAGTPAEGSATGAALPEVSGVKARTEQELNEAIDQGQLTLYHDGRKIRLGRAVNSKTTVGAGENDSMKKIKVIETIDLIHYYAITTAEDEYLGQCANTYDNKMVLLASLRSYLKDLEDESLLEAGSSGAELDVEAIRAYLKAEGVNVADLSQEQLCRHRTGSYVFISLYGTVLDAMEDFRIGFTLKN